MVEATRLRSMASSTSMASRIYRISCNILIGTRFTTTSDKGQTDRQRGELASLAFLFKESRLTKAITYVALVKLICREDRDIRTR